MGIYRLGFIVVLFVSCRNAGGGRSQSGDTVNMGKPRDTIAVPGGRDTPAIQRSLAGPEEDTTPPQAITLAKRPPGPPVDTVLDIDIDDVSLEGSDVKASYIRDTLRSAEWEIMGETFQTLLVFTFSGDGKVKVKERTSRYKVSMGDVKSKKDMKTDSVTYQIDTNGVPMSDRKRGLPTGTLINMFSGFKKNVPMILKP
ncbi:MAG TPA: hypothetical protein VHD83_24055 [Puia sp.]|nr:hypothetical protein [Puia sp.]